MNLKAYNLEPLIKLAKEQDAQVIQTIRAVKGASVEIKIIITPV